MEIITSRDNRWMKRLRDAIAEHRDEIVLEGPKQIRDAVARGWEPIVIVLDEDAEELDPNLVSIRIAHSLFRNLTDSVHPQGILALFQRPPSSIESLFRNRTTIVAALDGVQDPGNVGTIVRLAAAFDAGGLALTEGCADPFSLKAIRASAGTVLDVAIHRTTRRELLSAAAEHRFEMYVADASSRETHDVPAREAVIVFGSEGSGVARELVDSAHAVSIAMSPRAESLNVATAAAILLAKSFEKR